jgi:hypothetical protein
MKDAAADFGRRPAEDLLGCRIHVRHAPVRIHEPERLGDVGGDHADAARLARELLFELALLGDVDGGAGDRAVADAAARVDPVDRRIRPDHAVVEVVLAARGDGFLHDRVGGLAVVRDAWR